MKRIFFLLLLAACTEAPQAPADPVAEKVKTEFGAKSCTIDYQKAHEAGKDLYTVDFTLDGIVFPKFEDQREQMTSAVAFALFDAMPDSTRKIQEYFRITLKNGDTIFTQTYAGGAVGLAHLSSTCIRAFFRQARDSSTIAILDERFYPDSSIQHLKKFMSRNTLGNENASIRVKGFSLATDLTAGEEVIVFNVEEDKGWLNGYFVFYVSRKSYKIVFVEVRYGDKQLKPKSIWDA